MKSAVAALLLLLLLLLLLVAPGHARAQPLAVRSLRAEDFERETQAAGGQTSGRWLVLMDAGAGAGGGAGGAAGRVGVLEEVMRSEMNTDEVAINAAYVERSDARAFAALMARFGVDVDAHRFLLFHSGLMFECPAAAEGGGDEMMRWALDTLREDADAGRLGREVPREATFLDRAAAAAAELVARLLGAAQAEL